jgi:TrmH family RNA methyltransferase
LGLALDGVRDPGNVGTMIRSAVAAGVDAILLLPGTADPFGPKAVRASAGLVGVAPLVRLDALSELPSELFDRPLQVVLADADAETPYTEIDWSHPSCLVIGGETAGFAPASRASATHRVRIPMQPPAESLNAGTAAAVVLFEAVRRRGSP